MPNKSIGLSYQVLKEIVLADNNNLGTEVYCPTCNTRVSNRLTYNHMCPFCNTLITDNVELSKANFLTSRSHKMSEAIRKNMLRAYSLDREHQGSESIALRSSLALDHANSLVNKIKSVKVLFGDKNVLHYDVDLFQDAFNCMLEITYVIGLIDAYDNREKIINAENEVEVNSIATIYIGRGGNMGIVPHSHYMTLLSSMVNQDTDLILKRFLADMNVESNEYTFMSDPVELLESNKDIFRIIRVTETMGNGYWEWKQIDDPIKMLFKHGSITLTKVNHETNNVL